MDTQSFDIIILGAGAAGTSLAWYAAKEGLRSLVIEKSKTVGGLCRSWQWENFIVDTGPHIFHSPDDLITKDWKENFYDQLLEGRFFSANYLHDFKKYIDYPLSIDCLNRSNIFKNKIEIPEKTTNKKNLARATSFKEYVNALVGDEIQEIFFKSYPEKLWGIPTSKMLPDWAPKRIRITKERESFFDNQFCAVSKKGTGNIFEEMKNFCESKGCKFLLENEIKDIEIKNNTVVSIKFKNHNLCIHNNSKLINTLPITLISRWLGIKCNLSYRGVVSTYFTNTQKESLLPMDYSWIYFQDDNYKFNRITEPTKMCRNLCLDQNSKFKNYLISEATFGVKNNIIPFTEIEQIKNDCIKDFLKLPFIDLRKEYKFAYNIEPYVYPIQDQNFKLEYKRTILELSKIDNLNLLGASSEFQYSDMQVIFRKSKDFIQEFKKELSQDGYPINRNFFEKKRSEQDLILLEGKLTKNERPKIIVEIGINHNGSYELLSELIEDAAEAGGDIIKLQLFQANKRIGSNVKELQYNEKAQYTEENIKDILETSELTFDEVKSSLKLIESLGKESMCSGFSLDDFKFLKSIGIKNLKVASMDFNNIVIHNYLSKLDEEYKVFISTGMCSLEEINLVLEIYKQSSCKIILLHCTSSYPLPYEDVNLNVLTRFDESLPNHIQIGYSDHTVDNRTPIAALHYGISYIEKHFTLNKNMRGPDHFQSMTKDELKELIRELEIHNKLRGSARKRLQSSEYEAWRTQKKSMYAAKNLIPGEKIDLEKVIITSPALGEDPITLLSNEDFFIDKDIDRGEPVY